MTSRTPTSSEQAPAPGRVAGGSDNGGSRRAADDDSLTRRFAEQVRQALYVYRYHRAYTPRAAKHDAENVFGKLRSDLASFGYEDLKGLTFLDLGCGQRFPVSILAADVGAVVTALDVNVVRPQPLVRAALETSRRDGIKRAAATTVRRLLFDSAYYRTLFATSGARPSSASRIQFVLADPTAGCYPLPSATYDVVASNAVLEHVADVDSTLSEVRRVLKRDGIFHCLIHNFYSLSGGHNMRWAYPDSDPPLDVPPWDHLRQNLYPTHVYLNRLKPDEYLGAFERYFTVLRFEPRDVNHDPGGKEGDRFLTEDVRSELRHYPDDLLLTRAWCVIAKPKP